MKFNPGIQSLSAAILLATSLNQVIASPISTGFQVLPGHIPASAAALQPISPFPETNQIIVTIGLPMRNKDQFDALLEQLYDPASSQYHKWLSSEQFKDQFSPTAEDYQTVANFLVSQGLKITDTLSSRMNITASGSVGSIQNAFNVNLSLYAHPTESRTFFAPSTEPRVSSSLPVLHISGLDNFVIPRPASIKVSEQPNSQPSEAAPQSGSGNNSLYFGPDFRAAYASGVTLTGTGQYVGLLQFDGYYPADIYKYMGLASITNIPIQNVLLNGFSGTPGSGNIEVALDIEMSLSMAPGLSGVILYEGLSGNSIIGKMASDNLAKQCSASWTYGSDTNTTLLLQQMAAQGQSFFNAVGDSGAYPGQPSSPTDNPYLTCVGGTTLTTRGPASTWVSEKTWSQFNSGGGTDATSGGISTVWAIPTWQQGINMTNNKGSTVFRNEPDVAMVSDNVECIYNNGTIGGVVGDSIASPLWAAFTALANQQSVASGGTTMGLLNPAVYAIGKGAGYSTNFHDITSGNNTNVASPTLFPATAGYDLCTGWGTPTGKSLLNTLAPPPAGRYIVKTTSSLTLETSSPTNGVIDAGEVVTVSFGLQNIGSTGTTALIATLQSNSTVTPITLSQSYGALTSGGAAVSKSFTFLATGTCGGTISPTFQLQDGTNVLNNVVFTLPLGAPVSVFTQNFDTVTVPGFPSGWTRAVSGSVSNWVTTASFRYSTNNSMSVGGSTNAGVSDVISPPIAITTSNAILSFRNSYAFEANATNSTDAYDGGFLEIQVGTNSYMDILDAGGSFSSNGYNMTIDSTTGSTFPGHQAWGGTSGGFILTSVNLPPSAAGQSVHFKWRLASDVANGAGSTFWYLDNILVQDGINCVTPPASADLSIVSSVNPAIGTVGQSLSYSLGVTNLGPGPATSITVTDTIPAGTTFVSASGGGVYTNGTVVFSSPFLTNGGFVNYTLILTPSAEGSYTNTVSATSTYADTNLANNVFTSVTPVYTAPFITNQPVDFSTVAGGSASFFVGAGGTSPLSYQWMQGGTNIPGATSSTLILTNVQLAQAGVYSVSVSNIVGSVVSGNANLNILVAPVMQIGSVTFPASTNVSVTINGVVGQNYLLQYKTNLLDPTWTSIQPPQAGAGVPLTLVDTNYPLVPFKFYRVSTY